MKLLQENFGPVEFRNPDEYLCAVKQIGTVHDYRQEFARRVSFVIVLGSYHDSYEVVGKIRIQGTKA